MSVDLRLRRLRGVVAPAPRRLLRVLLLLGSGLPAQAGGRRTLLELASPRATADETRNPSPHADNGR